MTTKPKDEPTTAPKEERPVTMADVAALQGIGAGPDASLVKAVSVADAHAAGVFVSAGMASDLEVAGWCASPVDRTVIASDKVLAEIAEARAK